MINWLYDLHATDPWAPLALFAIPLALLFLAGQVWLLIQQEKKEPPTEDSTN